MYPKDLKKLADDFHFRLSYSLFLLQKEWKKRKTNCLNCLRNENGMGTIEMVLIIVVLITLVLLFKGKITKVLTDTLNQISSKSRHVY